MAPVWLAPSLGGGDFQEARRLIFFRSTWNWTLHRFKNNKQNRADSKQQTDTGRDWIQIRSRIWIKQSDSEPEDFQRFLSLTVPLKDLIYSSSKTDAALPRMQLNYPQLAGRSGCDASSSLRPSGAPAAPLHSQYSQINRSFIESQQEVGGTQGPAETWNLPGESNPSKSDLSPQLPCGCVMMQVLIRRTVVHSGTRRISGLAPSFL